MADLSLLFTDQLAQAIAEGRKTVTRRPISAMNSDVLSGGKETKLAAIWIKCEQSNGRGSVVGNCVEIPGSMVNGCWFPEISIGPRRSAGDMLVVRECFNPHYFGPRKPAFRANWDGVVADVIPEPKWKPSIHMPRWAARSVRRILSVTPERLGLLSEAEARAEGFGSPEEFADAWAGIYGSRVRWVWRYEFERTNEA